MSTKTTKRSRRQLEAVSVTYYSQRDEAIFFSWLDEISCVSRYHGVGKTLFIEIASGRVSDSDFREILALFKRYCIDLTQLAMLLHTRNRDKFRARLSP